MITRHHPAPERAIEHLEHAHRTDVEAVTVQLQAVGRAIEALAGAVEALAADRPGDIATAVLDRVDAARWELKDLW